MQAKEKFIKSQSPLQDQDIDSFIEAKVRGFAANKLKNFNLKPVHLMQIKPFHLFRVKMTPSRENVMQS